MTEPLPLVPATWTTGGSRRSGWPSVVEQAPDAVERQVDDLRMQLRQPLENEVGAGGRIGGASAASMSMRRSGRAARRGDRRGAGSLRRGRGLTRAQQAESDAQHAAMSRRVLLGARHHHIDHAVLQQIFGALEPLGQLLADGLLDHARAGEADDGAGLGDGDVAQHGEGGADAAGGRIGQQHDVGQARLLHLIDGDDGARHLHQRQDAFLHARAAGGRDDERAAPSAPRRAAPPRSARRRPPCPSSRP